MNAKTIKWAARLKGVREVSLLGTANLAYWKSRLPAEGLVPAEQDGRAKVLVIAAAALFKGISFAEVSFSIVLATGRNSDPSDAYLVHAYNSRRFFALCERVFFATPYYHA